MFWQKLFVCVFLLQFISANVFAQEDIYWAHSVVDFSSQRSDKFFSAQQLLGKPNTIPDYGFSTSAWMPGNEEDNPFVVVTFENAIDAKQVVVIQNIYSGIITKIFAIDTNNISTQVFQAPINARPEKGGSVLTHNLNLKNTLINSLRIEFIKSSDEIPYAIDAIGLTTSTEPIQLQINTVISNFNGTPERLSSNINSRADEVTPVISPDGKTLYFDRKHHSENIGNAKNDDIWYSDLDYKFEWLPAKNIGPPLNNENHNYLCSISSDGKRILLGNSYGNIVPGQPGISIAYKNDDKWETPQDLIIDNFSNKNQYNEFCMSADGNVMMMSIETDATYGLKDIYVSFLRKANVWSEPINIGNNINTAGNEMSPYLAADNITMYFSSNGWPGYGGQDIFMTKRLDNSWLNWSDPINIGPAINTSGWDAYYTVDAQGTFAYYTSNVNTAGDLDIYRIRLPDSLKPEPVLLFSGKIFNKSTEEAIRANIYYNALDDMGGSGSSVSNIDSDFGFYLLRGSKYLITVSADGYFDQMAELDLTQAQSLTELKNNFYLIPKMQGAIIELNNIEFNANSSILDKISYTELSKVLDFMNENPSIHIEIRGHTNGMCEENFCNALSERRAQAVAQYLIDNGINADRVTYKGYGKQFPIADNDTPEGRQKNQRVEFMITEL
ncbi:MAG: OmpA family protein [Chitinophagales bacterium]|nr:OmpA family protein [Chitinophagales bacterium]MBP9705372.1 OmpA family protein [Chitinophagales bacterium]